MQHQEHDVGTASFILMKDSNTVNLHLELPRVDPNIYGREIFAMWTPTPYQSFSDEFLTDVNGFDFVSREVYQEKSGPFAASFYPVTSVISVRKFSS